MVELASLNSGCWQTWTWLSWPAWTWLLTGLSMHACWNRLFMAWWTNIFEQRCWNHHDESTAMFMHDRTCCHAGNDEITRLPIRRCCNNHELGCCIKSSFACSNIREQPLSIHQAVYTICWNMIEQYCYFTNPVLYHVNSVVTRLLNQQPWNQQPWNNPVIVVAPANMPKRQVTHAHNVSHALKELRI